eukprot:gnl/MRDRNA2_/MRDRNA2_74389_c0_seq1.p1 gnl/MRDRNA2_/MRDRNA2_74389_c0~~gnl/MRDRNA2_/MRDRNA2_74389_c0_seq1.p1  ORF type:complete len:238 (+),score=38.05 gnl/MRDRNA2_/MRDRNA2_74389_c0_seq1:82-714(+)
MIHAAIVVGGVVFALISVFIFRKVSRRWPDKKSKDNEKAKSQERSLVEPLEGDHDWHFFLSHAQATGGDQMAILHDKLIARGFKVWYDQTVTDVTEAGMKYGVEHSMVFVLFLSQGVLERPFVRLEITTAIQNNKKTVVMHEADERQGKFDFASELHDGVPAEIFEKVRAHNSIAFQRVAYLQAAMLDQFLKVAGMDCDVQPGLRHMDTE